MAHAQLPRQIYIARHGKHTARAHNPSSADNHRAVVERGLVPEDIFQQFGIHRTVQRGSGLDGIIQHVFPLKHHQRAGLALGKGRIGIHRLSDGTVQLVACLLRCKHLPEAGAAHLLQKAADFRLENDHQGYHTPHHELLKQIADRVEGEEGGDTQGKQQQQYALGHRAGVGAAHQHNHLIDKKGHDRDINHIRDTKQDDLSLEFLEQIQNAFHFLVSRFRPRRHPCFPQSTCISFN